MSSSKPGGGVVKSSSKPGGRVIITLLKPGGGVKRFGVQEARSADHEQSQEAEPA